ncbi:MAG: hypothetical protein ACRCVJ_07070 [Clostridium sp.]
MIMLTLGAIVYEVYLIIKVKRLYNSIKLDENTIEINNISWIKGSCIWGIYVIFICSIILLKDKNISLIIYQSISESQYTFSNDIQNIFIIFLLVMTIIVILGEFILSKEYITLDGYYYKGKFKYWSEVEEVCFKDIYFGNAKKIELISGEKVDLFEIDNKTFDSIWKYINESSGIKL